MGWKFDQKRYLQGTEKNQTRAMLRRELKAGRLEFRRTYYDYYDSCHAPVETPDAPWERLRPESHQIRVEDLKAGGMGLAALPDGSFELFTSWSNYEVRVIK